MSSDKELKTQEWSYDFIAEKVGDDPVDVEISAPEDCYPLLCNRLGLYSIESLRANLVLTRNAVNKVIHIDGKISAKLQQRCVVTNDPVDEFVEDSFEAWFSEPSNAVSFTKAKRERAVPRDSNDHPMLEEADDPEEIIDGKIDLGELVVQYLSLALNPYPKKEGVKFESDNDELDNDDVDDIYDNPFAALKAWKLDEKKNDK